MSQLKNIKKQFINSLKIFYKPREVFHYCKEESNWIVPLFIVIVICLISAHILVPNLIIPDQIERFANNPNLAAEQRETNINFLNSSFHYFTEYISTAFTRVIYYPLLAFLLTLLPLVFKAEPISYKYLFSAVIYTGIINSLGFLADSILKLQSGTLDIGLNLSLLFDNFDLGRLNYLFQSINIVGIWQVILLSMLISIFFKYSKIKAFGIILNFWLIIKLIHSYIIYLRATF
ncbi:YIP1 family protein [Natronospora cellulosivora (SeqCode)]